TTYGALVLFAGRRQVRHWPRLAGAAVFFLSFCILIHLLFADSTPGRALPAGVVGRALFDSLASELSMAATAIVVIAAMAVALILGSEFAFLKGCALVGIGIATAASAFSHLASGLWRRHRDWLLERREKAVEAKMERVAFLAQLEADAEQRSEEER